MLNDTTVNKLNELRLNGMADSYKEQLQDPAFSELSFEERFGLIIDEWLLIPLTNTEARDLLEIIEARHKTGSIIFSSQFSPGGWHGKIGEGTLADAILDRIIHNSYTVYIDGKDSMRKRKGLTK